MSLYAALKGTGPSGFGYGSTAEQVTEGLDLTGKTYLLTGCNSGIGLETLRVLLLRGGHVIAAARTTDKARDALHAVGAGANDATPVACELSEPASVRASVELVQGLGRPIDAVICNAGIMAMPKLQQKHGYELQFFTNHVGHFMLVTGLLDSLADDGRVVMVSSRAHLRAPPLGIELDNLSGERGYNPWRAYGQSKLANLLFTRELARRLDGTDKTAYALHPGVIKTNLGRHLPAAAWAAFAVVGPLFLKSVEQGASTQCYVATRPGLESENGNYFADCNVEPTSKHGEDDLLAAQLWSVSVQIVAGLE